MEGSDIDADSTYATAISMGGQWGQHHWHPSYQPSVGLSSLCLPTISEL